METKEIKLEHTQLVDRMAAVLARHHGLPGGYMDKNFDDADWELARLLASATPEPSEPEIKTPGQVAYEGYGAYFITDDAGWCNVSNENKAGWEAGAKAVLEQARERIDAEMFRPDPGEDEGKITLKTMVDYAFHKFREQMIEQSGVGAGVTDVLGTEAAYKAFVSAARDSLAMAGRHMLAKVEKVGIDD